MARGITVCECSARRRERDGGDERDGDAADATAIMCAMTAARSPWLLAVPLISASSLGAHSLAYRLTGRDAAISPADDTHGYLAHFPALFAPAIALVVFALALRTVAARRAERLTALPWAPFALGPALALAVQEHVEHAVHHGAGARVLEPTFALGTALAVPLGLAAFALARALLASAERAARAPAARLEWVSAPRPLGSPEPSSRGRVSFAPGRRPRGRAPPRLLPV
jgi:hypothetical protein